MPGDAQRLGNFLLGHGSIVFFQRLDFLWRISSHIFSLIKMGVTAAMWAFNAAANRRSAGFTNFNSYFWIARFSILSPSPRCQSHDGTRKPAMPLRYRASFISESCFFCEPLSALLGTESARAPFFGA